MAYFVRVATGLLLALCAAMIWTPVHASFPITSNSTYGAQSCLPTSSAFFGAYPTPDAACNASVTQYVGAIGNVNSYNVTGTGPYTCTWNQTKPQQCTYTKTYTIPVTTTNSCPANSTAVGSICTCNAGYVQEGASCTLQADYDNKSCASLASGLNLVGAPMVHYGAVGLTACFGGYVMSGSGAAAGGGQVELYGPFKCSGQSASSCSVVPKPTSITANCAPGSYPGTVNGVQVCIPPTDSVTAPKETVAMPPAPGASAPQIPGAPPGTTSTTETTTCTNGSCTTTINYKDSTGTSLGKKEEVKSQPQHCTDNPKAPGCAEAEASKFSGSCESGFTYKGDAISGAMALEIHRQNCLTNATSDESALYDAEKVKTGNRTNDLPGNQNVNVSSSNFDQSNALGVGAACIGDKAIVVMGASISLPFSNICPWLENLGMVLMALSALLSARIVTRG